MRQPVDAAALAVAHAARMNDGQRDRVLLAQEARFQRCEHPAGLVDAAARAVDQHGGAVGHQGSGRLGRYDLVHCMPWEFECNDSML
jgi:hypothetical protein